MKKGDIVTRKSYGNDINFIISDIKDNTALLIGLEHRLIADAPLIDMDYAFTRQDGSLSQAGSVSNIYKYKAIIKARNTSKSLLSGTMCGTTLHIDGDPFYLKQCMDQYEKLGVSAVGVFIEEDKQPDVVVDLLKQYRPNILVITGHDAIKKGLINSMDINNYKNSKYFTKGVIKAREYNSNYDELVIIAGGCKSHYEALMKAGANFASSPERILINITDPVYVACKFANTSVKEYLNIETISKDVLSGFGKMGGIETRGQCREVKPMFNY